MKFKYKIKLVCTTSYSGLFDDIDISRYKTTLLHPFMFFLAKRSFSVFEQ